MEITVSHPSNLNRYGGYRVGDCEQPPGVGQALRYLMIPGPITAVVIALVFLNQYPIDEKRARLNRQKIQQKLIPSD